MHSFLVLLCITLASLSQAANNATKAKIDSPCNGYLQYCSKKYSELTFVMAHNAYAVGDSVAANQRRSFERQLDDGIRGFMFDVHKKDGGNVVTLCHTSCELLDAGPFVNQLKFLKTWLDNSHEELITIVIENFGKFSAAELASVFKEAQLDTLALVKNPSEPWPEVQEIIEGGKKLIVFIDNITYNPEYPYIMPEFEHAWETAFSVNLDEQKWSCNVDRPSTGIPKAAEPLLILNHFVYTHLSLTGPTIPIPSFSTSNEVNAESLVKHVAMCGKKPNFIAVDFYENGDVLGLVAKINGVPPKKSTASSSKDKMASSAITVSSSSIALIAILILFIE